MRGNTEAIPERDTDPIFPSFNFNFKFMSNLQNESLLETFYEEALEELDIKNDSPFYADACKIAEQMAMDRLLSY